MASAFPKFCLYLPVFFLLTPALPLGTASVLNIRDSESNNDRRAGPDLRFANCLGFCFSVANIKPYENMIKLSCKAVAANDLDNVLRSASIPSIGF